MADVSDKKNVNFADEHPPTRPGPKTAIIAVIVLVGGLAIYYW